MNRLPEGMSTGYTAGYSQVSSQGTALKQHPTETVGYAQGEAELCRWHSTVLISFCLPGLSGGLMRKGALRGETRACYIALCPGATTVPL